jgi:hypothetical protein
MYMFVNFNHSEMVILSIDMELLLVYDVYELISLL